VNVHFYDRVARLEREHASFAIATVVARQSPVSSHLGDRALVFPDGHMEGFVGGSCSRDIVRRQALGAIRTRRPVLLQIRNGTVASAPGCDHDHDDGPAAGAPPRDAEPGAPTERVVIPMSCSSEGAVDVYIEPRVPLRRLVIVGFTPVADALARLASALDYNVVRVVADDELRDVGDAQEIRTIPIGGLHDFVAALGEHEREALVAVVASQGHYDELALEELHGFDIAFTGLLASRRRAATVLGVLAQQGVPPDRLAMIRNPVGLDIGARSPGEVAISILAEIIANGPVTVTGEPAGEAAGAVAVEIDPICGMEVETANARYRFTSGGRTFFFCCAGCRASFAADPERYLAARGSA
jgi:xanthine dehydrogenase accessory factor